MRDHMRVTLSRRSKEPKEFNHLIGIVAISYPDQRFGSLERFYNVLILNDIFSAGTMTVPGTLRGFAHRFVSRIDGIARQCMLAACSDSRIAV